MDFKEYQDRARGTAVYPGSASPLGVLGLSYCTLGMAGEAGEFANKVKKILRHDYPVEEARGELAFELGDVLWYLSESARMIGFTLEEIAAMNVHKLEDRRERGVTKGSGDHR